ILLGESCMIAIARECQHARPPLGRWGRGMIVRCALVMLASWSAASTVYGQADTAHASRRVLLEEAQHAQQTGAHARAFEFGQRAEQIQPTPSLTAFLASELAKLGRYAEALDRAERCLRQVEANPNLLQRDRIRTLCQELTRTLPNQVGRIIV